MKRSFFICILLITKTIFSQDKIELGIDVFLKEHLASVKGKKVGLLTNQTGVNKSLQATLDLLIDHPEVQITALYSPEHGLQGKGYAWEKIADGKYRNIPVYSLHGKTRSPTDEMLKAIDVLIYDIQDIGCRTYTYTTSLFYMMEACAKKNIRVIVLDRPNPLGGDLIDGPMLEDKLRSYIGYVNVPYCYGMTIGELASFFNSEYKVGCSLTVIPMKGWKRWMQFKDTGLQWIPTSPNIPEADTPFFYASTGILGELELVNIGVGYTLPFKIVGAPWIEAIAFAKALNDQKFEGVVFTPFYFRTFYGSHKGTDCEGVLIKITDPQKYKPLSVQYLILGILKSLYPEKIDTLLKKVSTTKKALFCKAIGNEETLSILEKEKYIAWKLIEQSNKERQPFLQKRKKYLIYP